MLCQTTPGHGLSVREGFDALVVAGHLFNIDEHTSNVNTWRFMSEVVYKFSSKDGKIPRKVSTMINELV